jgi:hypothetical protein
MKLDGIALPHVDYIINLMRYDFRWIEWNIEKARKHGCDLAEVEAVVNQPVRGFPKREGRKYVAQGRGQGNRWVQVVYLIDPEGTIFVIHAMPLTSRRRRGGR